MDLYEQYHISRGDERRGLFELVREAFGVERGLYPGCFVHVTPSFYIPWMVYVDSDARAAAFFAKGRARTWVAQEKIYDDESEMTFYHQDYTLPLPVEDASVELLISQYAGPVSEHCRRYLRSGGILIANNSHGDAGLAHNDRAFELVAVIRRRGKRFSLSTEGLDGYFVPRRTQIPGDPEAARAHLLRLGRGVGYTRSAADYVFRKR